MSENYNNIEDLFKDSFEKAKVKPSEQTWNNIENQLRSESYFYDKFNGYLVKPSARIWSNIQRKLFYVNFFRFNFSTFNFYYLVSILALLFIGTYSVISENIGYNQNALVTNNQDVSNYDIKPVETFLNTNDENKSDNNNNSQIFNKTVTEVNTDIEENDIIENINLTQVNYVANDINNNENIATEINADVEENDIIENIDLNPVDNVADDINNEENIAKEINTVVEKNDVIENINLTPADLVADVINNKENIAKEINAVVEEVNSVSYNAEYKTIGHEIINLIHKGPITLNTDSLIAFSDFEYKDTLGTDAFGDPIITETTNWSLDVLLDPAFTSSIIRTTSAENNNYEETYNNALSPMLSNSFGININYSYKNFIVQSGIYYKKFNEQFNYDQEVLLIDTTSYYETEYQYEQQYDTIFVFDLDEYLDSGDTSYIPYTISNTVKVPYEVLVTDYDSSMTDQNIKVKNTYSYIEIPLSIGYQFKQNKFTVSPKFGLITGLYINSSGKSLNSSYNIEDINNEKQTYIIPSFSMIAAIGFEYKINDFFSFVANPYYRKSINSIFIKSQPISHKFNAYGLKLGIRYNF